MKTSVMKKSLLDYAIKGFLSTKFRKDNPTLNALSEIESYNASILKDKRAKEKALKTLESSLKNEKDKEAKQNLKAQMTALKKEIAKLKIITPLESPNTFTPPFAIPESWVWVRLGDICEMKKGPFGSAITKDMFIPKNEKSIKVYEQKNAIYKNIEIGEYYISLEHFERLKQFEVYENDIIVSCAGTIGESYRIPKNHQRGIINQALMKIKLFDIDVIPYFLIVFDFILKELCQKNSNGSAIKNIPELQVLKNFPIPLPPLQEQKQIVQILDQLMELANEFERTQENLKRIEKRIEKSLLKFAIQGNLSKCYRKDNPSLNALSEIESYNASILKDKRAKEKALKTLESSLKNEKDKEAKQNLKSQMTALKKEITKLKIITPLTCHSDHSPCHSEALAEESIQSQHTKSPTKSIENANFQNTFTPPFEIPESWVWVRLGEVCEIINGISIVGIQLPALDVKYLRTKTNKIVLNSGNMVNINDRIILMDGENSGEVFVVKEKGFLGSTLKKLNFSKMVKIEFMDYLLLFYKDLLKGNKKGAAIPHLDRHLFLNLQIALPPMQEQKEIVKVLDSLFTLAKGLRVE